MVYGLQVGCLLWKLWNPTLWVLNQVIKGSVVVYEGLNKKKKKEKKQKKEIQLYFFFIIIPYKFNLKTLYEIDHKNDKITNNVRTIHHGFQGWIGHNQREEGEYNSGSCIPGPERGENQDKRGIGCLVWRRKAGETLQQGPEFVRNPLAETENTWKEGYDRIPDIAGGLQTIQGSINKKQR